MLKLDLKAPIAIGNSGHKSLISKINGVFFNFESNIPGIEIVNGVLDPNTISYSIFLA